MAVHSLLRFDPMTNSGAHRRLMTCVPVSTAGAHVQKHETHQSIPSITDRPLLDTNERMLLHELINRGWIVGCDGELLPPKSFGQAHA